MKDIRVPPNLTKARSKILHDAVELTKAVVNKHEWGFVFANEHGDLLIRVKDKFNGKNYFSFDSIDSLTDQLKEMGLIAS